MVATFSVLENMRRAGVREIVFTSSSTVYGDATQLPTPEDYPPSPISFYGMSKLIGEQLLTAVKEMHFDSSYLTKTTGWRPIYNSRDAVDKTVDVPQSGSVIPLFECTRELANFVWRLLVLKTFLPFSHRYLENAS